MPTRKLFHPSVIHCRIEPEIPSVNLELLAIGRLRLFNAKYEPTQVSVRDWRYSPGEIGDGTGDGLNRRSQRRSNPFKERNHPKSLSYGFGLKVCRKRHRLLRFNLSAQYSPQCRSPLRFTWNCNSRHIESIRHFPLRCRRCSVDQLHRFGEDSFMPKIDRSPTGGDGHPRWHFAFRIHLMNSGSYGNKIYVPVFRRLVAETDRLRSRPRFTAMALIPNLKSGSGF